MLTLMFELWRRCIISLHCKQVSTTKAVMILETWQEFGLAQEKTSFVDNTSIFKFFEGPVIVAAVNHEVFSRG
jgi:hypothetical protein